MFQPWCKENAIYPIQEISTKIRAQIRKGQIRKPIRQKPWVNARWTVVSKVTLLLSNVEDHANPILLTVPHYSDKQEWKSKQYGGNSGQAIVHVRVVHTAGEPEDRKNIIN